VPDGLQSADRLLQEAFAELYGDSITSTALGSIDGGSFAFQSQDDGTPEQAGMLKQYTAAVGGFFGGIAAMCLQPGPSGTIGSLVTARNYMSAVDLDLFAGCRPGHCKSHSLGKQVCVRVRLSLMCLQQRPLCDTLKSHLACICSIKESSA
jgi:hypothetical protein